MHGVKVTIIIDRGEVEKYCTFLLQVFGIVLNDLNDHICTLRAPQKTMTDLEVLREPTASKALTFPYKGSLTLGDQIKHRFEAIKPNKRLKEAVGSHATAHTS